MSEGTDSIAVDLLLQTGFVDRFLDNVNVTPEQFAKAPLQEVYSLEVGEPAPVERTL